MCLVKKIRSRFIPLISFFFQAVAVHCFHGRGRTGTILACYLVKTRGMAAKDAISYVRRERPWSVETRDQEETVYVYEQNILKRL